jgi:hypothetical protein
MRGLKERHLDRIDIAVLGTRFAVALPLGLALFMAALTPSYYRPMLSILGLAMISAAVLIVAGGFALTYVASGLMRRGGVGLPAGVGLLLGIYFLTFVTLWIFLLGPAIVILVTNQRS